MKNLTEVNGERVFACDILNSPKVYAEGLSSTKYCRYIIVTDLLTGRELWLEYSNNSDVQKGVWFYVMHRDYTTSEFYGDLEVSGVTSFYEKVRFFKFYSSVSDEEILNKLREANPELFV